MISLFFVKNSASYPIDCLFLFEKIENLNQSLYQQFSFNNNNQTHKNMIYSLYLQQQYFKQNINKKYYIKKNTTHIDSINNHLIVLQQHQQYINSHLSNLNNNQYIHHNQSTNQPTNQQTNQTNKQINKIIGKLIKYLFINQLINKLTFSELLKCASFRHKHAKQTNKQTINKHINQIIKSKDNKNQK
ncbi:hypothetical protein ABPG72_017796 [Tetrahymena utriculariae]